MPASKLSKSCRATKPASYDAQHITIIEAQQTSRDRIRDVKYNNSSARSIKTELQARWRTAEKAIEVKDEHTSDNSSPRALPAALLLYDHLQILNNDRYIPKELSGFQKATLKPPKSFPQPSLPSADAATSRASHPGPLKTLEASYNYLSRPRTLLTNPRWVYLNIQERN